MQTALHDPFTGTTPSQRMAAIEHRRRMERMRIAALPKRHVPKQDVLPPIPNEVFAEAAEMIWPRIVLSQVETILRAVLVHFPDVGISDLKSARRTDKVVRPRQIAMYLAKTLTTRSLPDIGRRLGGRDHSTIHHAVRKIEAEMKTNPDLAEQINKIRATIEEMQS